MQITKIDDKADGFTVFWFDAGVNRSATFAPRPPEAHQMDYANACVAGEVKPIDMERFFPAPEPVAEQPVEEPPVEEQPIP